MNALQLEMRRDSWCETLPTREAHESLGLRVFIGSWCPRYTLPGIYPNSRLPEESSIAASTTLYKQCRRLEPLLLPFGSGRNTLEHIPRHQARARLASRALKNTLKPANFFSPPKFLLKFQLVYSGNISFRYLVC